jgi:hypothetical protein
VRSIDVHFHVVPPRFVDAVRRGEFADTVELVRDRGADRMTYHAPPDVVLEPGTTLLPHLYDEGLILEALDRRGLDAAAVGLSPEEFYSKAESTVDPPSHGGLPLIPESWRGCKNGA